MSHQYQPTLYYDWPSRNHGITLEGGVFKYIPYEYYAGDQIHHQNTVFRDCEYVTHDNTHVRFLNASDLHLYDTSGIKIYDSGTLTMHTSASPDSRGFIVDQIGRVGIGMDHTEPHSNGVELPSFDLDVKGQVGVEDYIYHNDDVDTYMLFGSDLSAHNVNEDGSSNTVYPDDQDEINFFTGDTAMLQMRTRDHVLPASNQYVNDLYTSQIETPAEQWSISNGTISAPGIGPVSFEHTSEVVDTTPAGFRAYRATITIPEEFNTCLENPDGCEYTVNYNMVLSEHPEDGAAYSRTFTLSASVDPQDHVTVNKYQSDVDFVVRSETNTGAFVVSGDGAEVVVNEDGNADTDFRVESDHEDHMLFVDTSVNRISIGDSEDTPQATLEVTNDPDSGAFDVPLVQLNNEDTDKQLLDINAKNIDADVISVSADDLVSADVVSVTADSLTTGDVFNATADSLTTGSLIHMTHTGSDKSEVSLVHFESTGDRGDDSNQTVLLDLNFDTTDGTGARALRIDSEQTTGTIFEIDVTPLTTGKGLHVHTNSRTTGELLHLYDASTVDATGSMVRLVQDGDRSGNLFSRVVDINMDTTNNPNSRTIYIDTEQRDGTVIEVDASPLTTGKGLHMHMDSRTTGTGLHIHDAGTADSKGALVKIEQVGDRDGTQASIGMDINFDTTANPAARALRIDSEQTTGTVVEIDAQRVTTGTAMTVSAADMTTGTGLEIGFDSRTTGTGVHIVDTHNSDSAGSLVKIEQDGNRTGTQASIGLDINFDTTVNPNARAFKIDSEQTTGVVAEIDASKLTTGAGLSLHTDDRTSGTLLAVEDSGTSDTAGSLVKIKQTGDRDGSAASIGLDINFDTTANANARAFRIDSEQTTGVVAEIDANKITTGTAVFVDADALTTGTILNLDSNSGATGNRDLVKITNDNTAAIGARLLHIKNDAIASGSEETVRIESTAADKNSLLELRNSNSAQDTPPLLNFKAKKNLSADVDIGTITFEGEANGASSPSVVYAAMSARATDVENNNFGGVLNFMVQATDSPSQLRNMLSIGGQTNTSQKPDTQAEVVINEDQIDLDFRVESNTTNNAFIVYGDGKEVVVNENGSADTDFRVESDNSTKMLYVDTENEIVEIRGPANDDTDIFLIAGTGDNGGAGHELLAISPTDTVFNESSNLINFRVESGTNQHALFIKGDGSEVIINDDGVNTSFRVESDTNTHALIVKGDGSEVVVNDTGGSDTDFRIESSSSPASATDTDTSGGHIAHKKTHAFFVNTSTGKVGLGTSDPQTTLHVAGSAQIEGDLWVKGVTNQIDTLVHVTSAMDITNEGTGPALTVTQNGAQPVAAFYDGNGTGDKQYPALYIENGDENGPGNVGIGTNNPAADLHLSKASTINEDNILRITSLHNSADPVFQMFGQNDNHGEGFELWYDNSTGAAHMATLNTSEASDLIFHTKVNSKSTSNERLRIESAGNIGINQSTPWTKLYIESTDGVRVPVGTTSQRPTSGAFGLTGTKLLGDGTSNTVNANRMLGTIRYNTDQSTFEGFGPGYKWGSLGGVIDVDRDTYWTAVNDLENIHTDEFDSPSVNNEYPGDTDYLRAFTNNLKRFAIASDGSVGFYRNTEGSGTTTDKYTYNKYLKITSDTNNDALISCAGGSINFSVAAAHKVDIGGHNGTNTGLSLAGTLVTATAKELNIMDGGATRTEITINKDQDEFVMNDNGTMKQVAATSVRDFARGGFTNGSRAIVTDSSGSLVEAPTTSTEIGYLDITTLGSSQDSKVLTQNANGAITIGAANGNQTINIASHDATDGGLKLAGTLVTSTAVELNKLDGCTASTTELNYLDINTLGSSQDSKVLTQSAGGAITIGAANGNQTINIASHDAVDGGLKLAGTLVTATAAEINLLDQSTAGTVTNSKAAVYSAAGQLPATTLKVGSPTAPTGSWKVEAEGNGYFTGDLYVKTGSDKRLKDDITPISDPIDKIKKIGGYKFKWNDKSTSYTGEDYGVIAQEVEQIMPEIVEERDNGYKALSYDRMIPLLIECVKSQQEQIEQLKQALEAK